MTDGAAEAMGAQLLARGETLAVAESCTGGYLGHLCTLVQGSSDWFLGGIICYANEVKTRELGVSEEMLADVGAVSEPVARQIAHAVQERFGSSWGIGISGIAGPNGGTAEKPVGVVMIAIAGPDGVKVERCQFHGDRLAVKQQAAEHALELVLRRSTTDS